MKVDIAIELPGDGEDARDLAVRIAVGVGTAADEVRAPLVRLNQEFIGAGIVEQAFLRKDTDFEIDCPGVILLELPDGAKSLEADARVDLHMGAHPRGALQDSLLERAAGAAIDVVLAEGALGRRHFVDGLAERSVLRLATVEDAGFVEMNMRLDEARDDESPG